MLARTAIRSVLLPGSRGSPPGPSRPCAAATPTDISTDSDWFVAPRGRSPRRSTRSPAPSRACRHRTVPTTSAPVSTPRGSASGRADRKDPPGSGPGGPGGGGRDGDWREVRSVEPVASGARVSYESPGLTEWYVNRSEGLEQGYTVYERPEGGGTLRIEGVVQGELRAILDDGGEAIDFFDDDDVQLLGTRGSRSGTRPARCFLPVSR